MPDPQRLRDAGIGVDVDLGEHPGAGALSRERFRGRAELLARPHQSAQRSRTTGTCIDRSRTSAWNVAFGHVDDGGRVVAGLGGGGGAGRDSDDRSTARAMAPDNGISPVCIARFCLTWYCARSAAPRAVIRSVAARCRRPTRRAGATDLPQRRLGPGCLEHRRHQVVAGAGGGRHPFEALQTRRCHRGAPAGRRAPGTAPSRPRG